jgi:hypothetical protein
LKVVEAKEILGTQNMARVVRDTKHTIGSPVSFWARMLSELLESAKSLLKFWKAKSFCQPALKAKSFSSFCLVTKNFRLSSCYCAIAKLFFSQQLFIAFQANQKTLGWSLLNRFRELTYESFFRMSIIFLSRSEVWIGF